MDTYFCDEAYCRHTLDMCQSMTYLLVRKNRFWFGYIDNTFIQRKISNMRLCLLPVFEVRNTVWVFVCVLGGGEGVMLDLPVLKVFLNEKKNQVKL